MNKKSVYKKPKLKIHGNIVNLTKEAAGAATKVAVNIMLLVDRIIFL